MLNKLKNLPSIAWVVLLPLGLIVLIGSIILIFYLIAVAEGFASIGFLIVGYLFFRGSPLTSTEVKEKIPGFATAAVVVFFALMGMAVDQPGNFIYNKPLELFCPNGTQIIRDEIISHPLPERTDINQRFACVDTDGEIVEIIALGPILLTRFVEYVVIAYLLMFLAPKIPAKKAPLA